MATKGFNVYKAAQKCMVSDLVRMQEYTADFLFAAKDFEAAVLDETKQIKFKELGKKYSDFLQCTAQVAQTAIKLEEIFGGAKRGNTK